MIVHLCSVRSQDENKREAIFEATIKLVNEIGFAAASVAKIANEANVSPSTIYIYYKNKEDLLVSIYVEIKKRKSLAAMKGFDGSSPLKESFRAFWNNSFEFVSEYKDYLQYDEQFSNSPYNDLVDSTEGAEIFQPFVSALESGAKQRIIKEVDFDFLAAFMIHPIAILSNTRSGRIKKMTREDIDTTFDMSWDAIKLDRTT
jgi:AcrR family transcriptional regulator